MSDAKLEQLKTKYRSVLSLMTRLGVQLKNLHLQNEKLFIRAEAKTKADSNKVWDQIKGVDPKYADLIAEITFLSDAPPPPAPTQPARKTHTVKAGETLSAIAEKYYGSATRYMKIFDANKDKLKDPNRIFPGQELVIPE